MGNDLEIVNLVKEDIVYIEGDKSEFLYFISIGECKLIKKNLIDEISCRLKEIRLFGL